VGDRHRNDTFIRTEGDENASSLQEVGVLHLSSVRVCHSGNKRILKECETGNKSSGSVRLSTQRQTDRSESVVLARLFSLSAFCPDLLLLLTQTHTRFPRFWATRTHTLWLDVSRTVGIKSVYTNPSKHPSTSLTSWTKSRWSDRRRPDDADPLELRCSVCLTISFTLLPSARNTPTCALSNFHSVFLIKEAELEPSVHPFRHDFAIVPLMDSRPEGLQVSIGHSLSAEFSRNMFFSWFRWCEKNALTLELPGSNVAQTAKCSDIRTSWF